MNGTLGRWRVAARLARRQVRRHLARSVLVVVIIALPVLAAQAAAIAARSIQHEPGSTPNGDQALDPQYAGADEFTGFDPRLGRPPAVAGATRVETGFRARDWTAAVDADEGVGPDDLLEVDVVGFVPKASEVGLVEGVLPRSRHEVVIGGALAHRAGLAVGDRFEIIASGVTLEVVGVGDRRTGPTRSVAWAGPPTDDEDDWVPEALALLRDSGSPFVTVEVYDLYWLPDGPVATPADGISPDGFVSEPALTRPQLEEVVVGAAGAAIGVGFVATVCSAAFAIGARRQLRDLGTLATAGASPADLVRGVILQGTTLGLAGATVATVLAYVGRAVAVHRYLDDGRWDVPWSVALVLGVAALGVTAGTVAALVPAITASRVPTLSALAGRRPEPRRRRRSPALGAGLVVVGLALLSVASGRGSRSDGGWVAAAAAIGVLAVMAGSVALSPALVAGLARLCARGRGTVRLAGRSLARDGMRSAAVVASTAVAVAIPVVVLVWGARETGVEQLPGYDAAGYTRLVQAYEATGQVGIDAPVAASEVAVETLEAVRRVMGPDAVVARSVPLADANGVAVDPDELRRATGDDEVADALEDGAVVVPTRPVRGGAGSAAPVVDGRPIHEVDPDTVSDLTLLLFDRFDPSLLVRADAEAGLGGTTVLRPAPLTDGEVDRLRALSTGEADAPTVAQLRDLGPDTTPADLVGVYPLVDDGPDEPPVELLVFLATVLVALAVIGTASALAAADGRGDERIVAAVGAPPAVVRRRRTLEATFTAAAATVLGVGLGAAATLTIIHHPLFDEPGLDPLVRFPILDVAGVAVGMVGAVGATTWVALTVAGRLRGRRDLVLVDR